MRGPADAAISDIAGTLLMVGAVVLAGGLLTGVVTTTLSKAPAPAVSFALAPVAAGDATLALVLKNGADLALADLAVSLQRGEWTPASVPAASWSTPNATLLRAGDRLTLPLAPAASAGEPLTLRVVYAPTNTRLAELRARAGAPATSLGAATVVGGLVPAAFVADGVSAASISARVSHPLGAGAIARVSADLVNLTMKARSANATLLLNDAGVDGDLVGGDGNWTALLRAPALTEPGLYNVTINATDLAGALAATTTVRANITGNVSFAVGGTGGGAGGGGSATVTNSTGNFTGPCYNCTITGGVVVLEGTRLPAPTSANITKLRFTNFTWDRQHPDQLASDAGVARIISGTWSWSVYLKFAYTPSTSPLPSITRMEMWNANGTTVYIPAANGRVPISALDLNLLNPTASGFVCETGCASPMTYNRADIRGEPVFIVSYLRDESNNFQTTEISIQSIDAVLG